MEQGDLHVGPLRLTGQLLHPLEHHHQGGDGTHSLSDQGGPGHPRHPHVELDDEEQVQHDVGQAGDHEKDQRRFAVSLGVVDAVEGVVQKQEHRSSKVDPQVQPGVIHNVRVGAQQLEQRAGEHRPQGHDDEAQHAQGDDSGGDGGLHLVDAPGPEQLGDHHVTAHRQPGGHRHRQKHDGEGGAYRCHRVLPHELAHYSGVHHVVQLLEQIARHHRQGKEKQQVERLALCQIFNHRPLPLLFCIA